MLHHAINGKSDERARAALDRARRASSSAARGGASSSSRRGGEAQGGATPASGVERPLPPVSEVGGPVYARPGEGGVEEGDDLPFTLNERLPVIHSVLEFAREKLWMPEVRAVFLGRHHAAWIDSINNSPVTPQRATNFPPPNETLSDRSRRDVSVAAHCGTKARRPPPQTGKASGLAAAPRVHDF